MGVLSFGLITFVLFYNPVFSASGLKVFVNLHHNEMGSASVCVFSDYENVGCKNIPLSKYNSPTELGPWQFSTGIIPEDESFTVCVTNYYHKK